MKKYLFCAAVVLLSFLPAQPSFAGEVFDRVMKERTLRCGYAMWSPILYQNLQTGELEGFAHDFMEEIGARLDIKIDWAEETGWGSLIEGILTKRYDMICVIMANSSERGKFIDFSTPVFYSPTYFVARADDTRFDNDLNVLNDPQYKIAVLEGEMTAVIAKQHFPLATASAISQIQDYSILLKEVETRKADVTIITPETFAEYDEHNPGKLKIMGLS